jgi:caffeoyl-CoA O-methyltransferase
MIRPLILLAAVGLSLITLLPESPAWQPEPSRMQDLDAKVRQFLSSRRQTWHDLNIPETDGQQLHDIITKHKYRNALEIGTSTGHSGIWIAWALAKTGGKLVTIEIDSGRHEQAKNNFREAGLSEIIEARLGDAHKLVPELKGPFDFIFCDADKDWYKQYLAAALPKLAVGGCFAAHNVSERSFGGNNLDFLRYARSLSNLETTLYEGGSGLSLSYKTAEK